VLFGGRPAHIFEPSVKEGEMMVYTPAVPAGWHEVEVVFTSGHIAKWRDGKFRTHSRHTPFVSHISHASAIIDNVTWEGDLKKQLDLNQQDIFQDTGEKRNATEIMHAYLGTGLEVLADKGGREEFRCDIIETPTMNNG
ncbi:dnaJ, partial [Symbiodinium pilosum]